jgi:hypothetical protein
MSFRRARHRTREWRRGKKQSGETLLLFHRQADDLRLFNRATRSFLRGSNEEVTKAASFDLCGAPDHSQYVRRNAGFDTLGSGDIG